MKLRYLHGTMGSMKSSILLMKAYQFEQSGCDILLIKPAFDTRNKEIKSRAIEKGRECISFDSKVNVKDLILDIFKTQSRDSKIRRNQKIVLCDEIQFATREQIRQLWYLTKYYSIDVYCFGLKLSYQNKLFGAAEELLILADTIEEIKSRCKCGNKATTHLRLINDKVVYEGADTIVEDIQGNERYESVCSKCWHEAPITR